MVLLGFRSKVKWDPIGDDRKSISELIISHNKINWLKLPARMDFFLGSFLFGLFLDMRASYLYEQLAAFSRPLVILIFPPGPTSDHHPPPPTLHMPSGLSPLPLTLTGLQTPQTRGKDSFILTSIHVSWSVVEFSSLGIQECVYKIWFSLSKGTWIYFLILPPPFWVVSYPLQFLGKIHF